LAFLRLVVSFTIRGISRRPYPRIHPPIFIFINKDDQRKTAKQEGEPLVQQGKTIRRHRGHQSQTCLLEPEEPSHAFHLWTLCPLAHHLVVGLARRSVGLDRVMDQSGEAQVQGGRGLCGLCV
jgi:hypothetical protein